jgi:hypothetical protein
VIVLWLLAAVPASSSAPALIEVAIMPVGGTQLSIDLVPQLEALDKDLRKQAPDNFHYQAGEVTRGQVAGARSLGVSCTLEDAACLAKIAALADVDLVVSPIATAADTGFALKLVVVNRAGEATSSEAHIPTDDTRAAVLLALATKALAQARVVQVKPAPDEALPTPPPAPAEPAQTPPAVAADPAPVPTLAIAGGAVAATRVGVALGTGVGALVLDASLAAPEKYEDRVPKMMAGRALVAVAAVSAVVAAGGAGLLGYSLASE